MTAPKVVDLTAAAHAVYDQNVDPSAVAVWCALTGLPRVEALTYAAQLAEDTGPVTVAVLPPF